MRSYKPHSAACVGLGDATRRMRCFASADATKGLSDRPLETFGQNKL